MLERGTSKAEEVRSLQRKLVELGYELPRFGIDGDLGTETIDAMARFLRDHGADVDDDADVISDSELDLLHRVFTSTHEAPLGPELPTGRFHDLRTIAAQNHVGNRRSWKQITGITLHQTACVLGEKPKRWTTVGAHLGVTRAGQVIWMHDFEKVVWHANSFNSFTVGIELDGTYEGVEGDIKTFWRPPNEPNRQPQQPTEQLVDAAQRTVRWICAEVARRGGRIERLLAHRQASKQRQSDPGSSIWKRVAMPLHHELKINDGDVGFVSGGLPIPEAWDESRKGVKY